MIHADLSHSDGRNHDIPFLLKDIRVFPRRTLGMRFPGLFLHRELIFSPIAVSLASVKSTESSVRRMTFSRTKTTVIQGPMHMLGMIKSIPLLLSALTVSGERLFLRDCFLLELCLRQSLLIHLC